MNQQQEPNKSGMYEVLYLEIGGLTVALVCAELEVQYITTVCVI